MKEGMQEYRKDRCFAVHKSAEDKKDRRFVSLVQNRTDVLEV